MVSTASLQRRRIGVEGESGVVMYVCGRSNAVQSYTLGPCKENDYQRTKKVANKRIKEYRVGVYTPPMDPPTPSSGEYLDPPPHPSSTSTPALVQVGQAGFESAEEDVEGHRINMEEKSTSLEYLLGNRASADQLIQQNIMHSKVAIAPAIQQTQRVLRFQKTADTLDQKLMNRPDKEELLSNNIIRSKSADNLQARQLKLNFQRTKAKLDVKLDNRPTPHQLQAQNIIKIGIAPSLYATQQQLKFIHAADILDNKLEHRPPRSVLVASNIVKGGDVAPSISATQQELKFHTIADTLDHKLDLRPTRDNLIDHNVIKEKGVHPSIQGTQQALKFNKTKSQVGHKMVLRPSKDSLVDHNILIDGSPFLFEKKKKLIRRSVSTSLSTHLAQRPSREEFDLRFRYYFTDSESSSSVDNASSYDNASTAGDYASSASDAGGQGGMLRAHSMPNCSITSIPEEESGSEDDGEGGMDGMEEEGGGDAYEDMEYMSRSLPGENNFEHYFDFTEDYKSVEDPVDSSLLSSSV